jgi:hypothetical protein
MKRPPQMLPLSLWEWLPAVVLSSRLQREVAYVTGEWKAVGDKNTRNSSIVPRRDRWVESGRCQEHTQ